MSQPRVLAYANCDTCRKALAWLKAEGIAHSVRPIVEAPPTVEELRGWVAASGLPLAKWFNTSGQSYRALGKAAVDAMTDAEKIAALAADGKLVKRPVLVAGETVLVGFNADAYRAALK
ncbi:MAG: Spx/MgsR family RNA polymerase-binding regulatory protein [Myxococcales bacterium]|nr:Spx/MgsR family RNA polymerase-binding regulatory protein [Myxococcales bacterium]